MGQETTPLFSTTVMNQTGSSGTAETNYANNKGFYITFNSMFVAGRVDFKAYLNQYHDNFTSDWSSEIPYGRVDSIKTFNRTTRMIDISFSIPAYTAEEAIQNLAKVSALIKMVYPSYENRAWGTTKGHTGTGDDALSTTVLASSRTTNASNDRFCLSAPPLITVKFANLIKSIRPDTTALPGGPELEKTFLEGKMDGIISAVTNLSVNPRVDAGFFHLKDGTGWMYPKVIDVAVQFNVLHQVSPGIAAADFTTAAAAATYGDLYGVGYGKVDGTKGDPAYSETPALSIAGARAALEAAGRNKAMVTNPDVAGPTQTPPPGVSTAAGTTPGGHSTDDYVQIAGDKNEDGQGSP
tara:strand:+ start:1538 stop:2596 length:1059 start_codon:yes stop_codon:yes gene_type:complete